MYNMTVIWMKELYRFVQECAKIFAVNVQKFTVLSLKKSVS